jgi:hypothetical protein
MSTSRSVVAVVLATAWTLACTNGPEVRSSAPSTERPKPTEAADSATRSNARDLCALLSATEVSEIFGVTIERAEKKPNGCEWHANAAAQQQKGADLVRSTFGRLTKEEPKSAEEGVRRMEDMLKGLTSAAGGRLELIDGLGDRAYVAAAGVLFYVRKGSALLTFGSLGTREQTIALARKLVSRI